MKILFLLLSIIILTSCSVSTSKIDANKFNTNDITYIEDTRTGVCYAIIAVQKGGNFEQNGIGFTEVPCDKVKEYLNK